jgi:putative methionine-R-sulfoxide reductase with GAF domain/CheY-like chemotaxis protein
MLANARLRIPEMDAFDQDEIDNNPVLNAQEHVTLFGALLVAEGLITCEQLKACLLLQAQDYPDTSIGQILLRCGYISAEVINQTLRLQTELKVSLIDSIDAQTLRPADLTAVLLHRHGGDRVHATLQHLGVATTRAATWPDFQEACREQQPDLILIDAQMIEATTVLPERAAPPIFFIPPIALDDSQLELPECIKSQFMRFVDQARAQRQQQGVLEHLQQREFELCAAAAMSRGISTARSSHDALVHLMSTIRDLFGVEAGTLYRFDRATEQLVFEVVLGPHQEKLYQRRLSIDRGIAGWVVRNSEPLLIPDVRRDPRFEGKFDDQSGFQTRSILCVPMIAMGQVRGVIQLINKLNGDFNERDLLLLRILATMGALVEAVASELFERDIGG